MGNIEEVVEAYTPFVNSFDNWEERVAGIQPKDTSCGPVYEFEESPQKGRTETFAIADMRDVLFTGPHYHINGETEIYFVLQGLGYTVVGGKGRDIKKGDVIVTPPHISHFTIPDRDLVIAVVNTPNFNHLNVVDNKHTDPRVKFDLEQFEQLTRAYQR